MTKCQRSRRVRNDSTLNALVLTALTSCVGTEADNPVVEPAEPTPCKSYEDYAPYQVADGRRDFTRRDGEMPSRSLLDDDGSSTGATAFANLGESLTPSNQFPRWLECIEWNYEAGELELQIVNFRSGCAIDWTGSSRMSADGNLEVGLEKLECGAAACGNCYYDVRTKNEVGEGQTTLNVDLLLRECDGAPNGMFSWSLPLAEAPRGMQCKALDEWELHFDSANFTTEQIATYAVCGESAVLPSEEGSVYEACAEGFECVDDRCLSPCTTAADCSLPVFECSDGHCRLPE